MTAPLLPLPLRPEVVPLLDLPGVLSMFPGAEHQPVRVETFPAAGSVAADLVLTRCRCGRLFDAAGMARHLNPAPADAAAATNRSAQPRRTR